MGHNRAEPVVGRSVTVLWVAAADTLYCLVSWFVIVQSAHARLENTFVWFSL